MIDDQFVELILTWVDLYGPWALGGMMFSSAVGLPLPVTPMVITAGALARLGYFNWSQAAIWVYLGSVIGDSTSYFIGRFAGEWAERIGGARFASVWEKARTWFQRFGGWAVLLSRFGFNSLDVPTSLIAGASRYNFWKYLIYVLLGRFLWITVYGGLGYAFSSQYTHIRTLIDRYSVWIGIALLIGVIAILLIRRYFGNWLEKLLVR